MGIILNTLTRLMCSGIRVLFFYMSLTKLGMVTVSFVLAVCSSHVVNQVGSYRYCEYANMTNVNNTANMLHVIVRSYCKCSENLNDGYTFI